MIERVLIASVEKYVCGKLVVQRCLVAVVAKVANEICDYSVINRPWWRWLQELQGKLLDIW